MNEQVMKAALERLQAENIRLKIFRAWQQIKTCTNRFGYLLSASTLILAMTVGLSAEVGELMLGPSTGHVNTAEIAVFAFFLMAAVGLLVKVLASVR